MRKKNILLIVEKIMWGLILLLPVLYWLVSPIGYSIGGGTALSGLSGSAITMIGFGDVLGNFGITTSNIVYTSLSDLFGSSGVLPFFSVNSSMLLYLTYFIIVEVCHLVVDCVVFIPRLAHKWMNKYTSEDLD